MVLSTALEEECLTRQNDPVCQFVVLYEGGNVARMRYARRVRTKEDRSKVTSRDIPYSSSGGAARLQHKLRARNAGGRLHLYRGSTRKYRAISVRI